MDIAGLSDFEAAGLEPSFKKMPNGECRFSIKSADGADYIRTVAGSKGGWQNAHYHGGPEALDRVHEESGVPGVQELYFVKKGWMAYAYNATPGDCMVLVEIFRPGMSVTSTPGEEHNVYLPAGAVIHTIKFGVAVPNPDRGNNDWWPASDAFDSATKGIDEVYLLLTKE